MEFIVAFNLLSQDVLNIENIYSSIAVSRNPGKVNVVLVVR